MAKTSFVASLMNEKVSLGGQLVTRAECYQILMQTTQNPKMADYFAFSKEAISEEEAARFCAVCKCGAHWQSVVSCQTETCPACTGED